MTDLLPLYAHTFENEVVLPEQWSAWRAQETPERRLLRAILQDAWECATKPLRPRKGSTHGHVPSQRIKQNEARAWILSDDATHTFTFVNLCAHLGLDPDAIRRALARAIAHGPLPPRPPLIDLPPARKRKSDPYDHTVPSAKIVARHCGYVTIEIPNGRRVRLCRTSIRPHSPVKRSGEVGPLIVSYTVAKVRGLLPYATPVPVGATPCGRPGEGQAHGPAPTPNTHPEHE